MAFGAKESTGVILPMLCMADIMAVVYYKRIADWKVVAKLLPTAIIGFFVAIFVGVCIKVEVYNGSFKLCACALIYSKSCTCNLCTTVKIKNIKICTDIPVRFCFKIKVSRF